MLPRARRAFYFSPACFHHPSESNHHLIGHGGEIGPELVLQHHPGPGRGRGALPLRVPRHGADLKGSCAATPHPEAPSELILSVSSIGLDKCVLLSGGGLCSFIANFRNSSD
ncbi:hypothetical protein SEVIR_4G004201v4 [Setaria viridis]|uniref:Uncharacterized protein n=1 Tax=Setaria viridis TaxID=4556 RepID=A0A4U6US27_SETVI|nr:hypothetical protein SEVIR_4G004201v2 [Setaria viridis]